MPDPKRFRNEAELRDFIKGLLEKDGYVVETEVKLEGVRLDLYAKKGNEFSAIEVKYRGAEKIPDDISKCVTLSFSPDVDRTYVAAPTHMFREEHIDMARGAGVGVMSVTEDGIEKEVESSVRRQALLMEGLTAPRDIYVGEEFTVHLGVTNQGGKKARNIELRYIPSGPFRRPKDAKNRYLIDELERGANIRYPFRVKVSRKAKPGEHPFFTRVSAIRIPARSSTTMLRVKKRPPKEEKPATAPRFDSDRALDLGLKLLEKRAKRLREKGGS